jgi:hypothetical protein
MVRRHIACLDTLKNIDINHYQGATMDMDLSDLLISSTLGGLLPVAIAIGLSWIKTWKSQL